MNPETSKKGVKPLVGQEPLAPLLETPQQGLPSHSFPHWHLPALAASITLTLEKAAMATPPATGKAERLAPRDVNLLVTQCLIYPTHVMLPQEKLINQVCISSAAP